MKYNSTGTLLWNRTWGASGNIGYGIAIDSNNNIYLAGRTSSVVALLLKYRPYIDVVIEAPRNLQATPSGWTNINSFTVDWVNPNDPSGIVGAYYKLDSAPTSDTDGFYVAGTNIEQVTGITVSGQGTHVIYIWLEDGFGNIHYQHRNSTTLYYDSQPPSYSNEKVSLTSPQNYTTAQYYQYNLTIIDNIALDTVFFEWDGTNHTVITCNGNDFYYDLYDLGAGTYPYRWYFNDTVNNWNSTPLRSYIISPITTGLELLLNGTPANYQINQSQACNITITFPITDTVLLYLNDSLIDIGLAPLVNISQYIQCGLYNVTAYYLGSQNYTAMSVTRWLTVIDIEPPLITHFANLTYLNSTALEYHHSSVNISANVVDNGVISSVLLCENSTGSFLNRTIINHIGETYWFVLDIGSLNYGETLAYYFYANDMSNLWGKNDNATNLFRLCVYDFMDPSSCAINYEIKYAPNFVLESTIFSLADGDDFGGSGISYYQYRIDFGGWMTGSVFNLSCESDGVHAIQYKVVDYAGNNGTLSNISVYLLANNADYDNDGLTNADEINRYYTNPLDADTDDDGFTDGEEIAAGTDPLNASDNPLVRERRKITLIIIIVIIGSVSTISVLYVKVIRKRKIEKELKLKDQSNQEIKMKLNKLTNGLNILMGQIDRDIDSKQLLDLTSQKDRLMSELDEMIQNASKSIPKWETSEYSRELSELKSTYNKVNLILINKLTEDFQNQQDLLFKSIEQQINAYQQRMEESLKTGTTLEEHNTVISEYQGEISKLVLNLTFLFQKHEKYGLASLTAQGQERLSNLQAKFDKLCNQNKEKIKLLHFNEIRVIKQKLDHSIQQIEDSFNEKILKLVVSIENLDISEALHLKEQLNIDWINLGSIKLDQAQFKDLKFVRIDEISTDWKEKLIDLQNKLKIYEDNLVYEMNLIKIYTRIPEFLKITGGHIKISALASNLNIEPTELKEICLLLIKNEKVTWRLGPDLDSIIETK
ncbi:MAG: SBBP repeat-containing protein [Candidatus Helarchaeota archaeon]